MIENVGKAEDGLSIISKVQRCFELNANCNDDERIMFTTLNQSIRHHF